MWFPERKALGRLLVAGLVAASAGMAGAVSLEAPDTLSVVGQLHDFGPQQRMSLSPFPVEVKEMGRALRIRTQNNPLLPIYTEQGVLFMAMRLSKGTNWLNGLPRGKYFINNQPVNIR